MKRTSHILPILMVASLCTFTAPRNVSAQAGIVEAVKAASKKVIKAVDLQVQRLQNNTIDLQNIQRQLENALSKLKLTDIADWTQKQKDLYQGYFDELWKVKQVLTYYSKVSDIISVQKQIYTEYSTAYSLIRQDQNFSPAELDNIYTVYGGMIDQSIHTTDDLLGMLKSFTLQMSDGERLALIDHVAGEMEDLLRSLRGFTSQNRLLSIQRTSTLEGLEVVKQLYGF